MNFRMEMTCLVKSCDTWPNPSAIAGFVLNSKVEGGCGNKQPLSELVAQIGLLEVPESVETDSTATIESNDTMSENLPVQKTGHSKQK